MEVYEDIKAVSQLIGISEKSLYKRLNLFPTGIVARIGRRVRFNRQALLEWLANGGGA